MHLSMRMSTRVNVAERDFFSPLSSIFVGKLKDDLKEDYIFIVCLASYYLRSGSAMAISGDHFFVIASI